jgi:hypothetical protein
MESFVNLMSKNSHSQLGQPEGRRVGNICSLLNTFLLGPSIETQAALCICMQPHISHHYTSFLSALCPLTAALRVASAPSPFLKTVVWGPPPFLYHVLVFLPIPLHLLPPHVTPLPPEQLLYSTCTVFLYVIMSCTVYPLVLPLLSASSSSANFRSYPSLSLYSPATSELMTAFLYTVLLAYPHHHRHALFLSCDTLPATMTSLLTLQSP